MGDDIDSGLSSMAVCFDFCSTKVVQLSNRNSYFYRFWCHHPLITKLRLEAILFGKKFIFDPHSKFRMFSLHTPPKFYQIISFPKQCCCWVRSFAFILLNSYFHSFLNSLDQLFILRNNCNLHPVTLLSKTY